MTIDPQNLATKTTIRTMEEAEEPSFMITLWLHVGKIRLDRTILWKGGDLRITAIDVATREGIEVALRDIETGVRRVNGFSDTLISIEAVVQRCLIGETVKTVKYLPETLDEWEATNPRG